MTIKLKKYFLMHGLEKMCLKLHLIYLYLKRYLNHLIKMIYKNILKNVKERLNFKIIKFTFKFDF